MVLLSRSRDADRISRFVRAHSGFVSDCGCFGCAALSPCFLSDNNLSNSTAESFLHSLPHSRLAVLLLDGNRIDFPHFHALGVAVARSKRRHVRSALAWQHGLVKELLKEKAKFASVFFLLAA